MDGLLQDKLPCGKSITLAGFYLAAEDRILDFLVVLTELRSPTIRVSASIRPRSLAFSLGAPSSASPLCARLLCSRHISGTVRLPALLTHVLPYAGRSNYAVVTLLTGKRLPSEPQHAWSAS